MPSTTSRRVVGSIALAAVSSSTAFAATPALAATVTAASVVVAAVPAPGFDVPPASLTVQDGSYAYVDLPLETGGAYTEVEYFDSANDEWHSTWYLNETRTAYLSTAGMIDSYRIYYEPVLGDVGTKTVWYRVVVDGVIVSKAAPLTLTVTPNTIQATPAAPTKLDRWGSIFDGVAIPSVPGVRYLINGNPVSAGFYYVDQSAVVTAEATAGYVLTAGTHEWAFGDYDETATIDLTSTGHTNHVQSVQVDLPEGADLELLDSEDGRTVDTTQGRYEIDGDSIRFTPAPGFTGVADGVRFEVTWIEESSDARYTPTVTVASVVPQQPTWLDSFGTKDDGYTIPAVEGVRYLVDGKPVQPGTYRGSGSVVITVEAQKGYVLTGEGARSWKPTFTAGKIGNLVTTGTSTKGQSATLAVPTGGSAHLLDGAGGHATTYSVSGQGVYRLAGRTITFAAAPGFYGKAAAVTFVVRDAADHEVTATYAATVAKPTLTVSAPVRTVSSTQAVATCWVNVVEAKSCTVTAYATIDGKKTKVGTGKVTNAQTKGVKGVKSVKVPVTLNKVGRTLAARPTGVKLALEATLTGTDKKIYRDTTRTTVVASTVTLRPVYFDADSAMLSATDRAYLTALRMLLGSAKAITITGHADARAPRGYNAALGKERAKAVAAVLTKGLGVKVTLVSKGEHDPASNNRTSDGRAQNRRVTITIHN